MRKTLFLSAVTFLCVVAASSPAQAQLEAAGKALRTGNYDRAEKLANGIKGAQAAKAALIIGRVFLETGRYEQAIKASKRSRANRAQAHSSHQLEGEALMRLGKVREAIRAFEASVKAAGSKAGWRSRLLLARAHQRDGNLLAARPIYESLADAYNDGSMSESDPEALTSVASAVVALEYYRDGNETFHAAKKLDPGRVETQTEWATLFLEKYDPGHAEECLRDALKTNPNHAEAHLLMAKVRMHQGFNFVAATEEIEKALKTNPNLAEAHAFASTLDVRDRLWEKAHKRLDRALAIDPSHPYALGVRAATYYIADDNRRFAETVAKLRARDRRYNGHIAVLTDLLEWEHRYEEIVAINRQALSDDASYWPAHAAIGINLLRQGDETEGLRELNESFDRDRYNILVYNMLKLYDNVLSKEYNFIKRGPIDYRFHTRDQKVLERYLPSLLSKAYADMSKRYGLRPAKTKVEIFVEEDHFARRSVGLPRVGVQGICFGKVIVAGGPRVAPVNYGQVLWHELGHVFTIQLSKSRVPRWFTEGLSVHEESLGSPFWVRDDDASLYRWVKAGRMPGVDSLNTAFSRAKSGLEINLAYYGSAKLVEHIKGRYGWPKVLQMLRFFGKGKRTGEVIQQVLKVSPAELDRQFRADLLKNLSRYDKNFEVDYGWYYDFEAIVKAAKASPNDATLLGRAAVAALANRDKGAAQGFAAKAIKIDPAQPEARHVLSDIAAATGNFKASQEHARALQAKGIDGYGLRMNLAEGARKSGDMAKAIAHYKAAVKLDPQQIEPHAHLAKIHLDAKRETEAIAELRKAADLTPHDRSLYEELVGRLVKRGDWKLVVQYGERNLWNDPFNHALHLSLAKAYEKTRNAKKAAFEYRSAVLCEPEDLSAVHLEAARFYKRSGKRKAASDEARRAVEAGTKGAVAAKRFLEELNQGRGKGAGSSNRRR